jgi:TonB family protein
MKLKLHRALARTGAIMCCVLIVAACGDDDADAVVQEPVPMPDPTPVEYPVGLWDRRVTGETEVLVHVNEFGDVDSAVVSRTSGHAEFDSAAVGGARRLRFTPGRRGDRHVPMWTRIPVRFAQDSATFGAPTATGITGSGQ